MANSLLSTHSRDRSGGRAFPIRALLLVFLLLAWSLHPQSAAAGRAARTWQPGMLEVTFFDVGKGDAIILHLPDGGFALVDTGYAKTAPALIQELRNQKVKKLDLVVLTHHDKDHVGGYPLLVEAFPIGRVVQSYDPRDAKKTPLVKPGSKLIDKGGVRLTTLGPWSSYEDENDASLVTRLEFGKISFLLAGDVIGPSQADLLTRKIGLRADVLKVPHHGRYHGFSPRAFFEAVGSGFAIITCDEAKGDPPEGSVLRMLEALGSTVLRTDRLGTIRFLTDGKILEYQGE